MIATITQVFTDTTGVIHVVYTGQEIDPTYTPWTAPVPTAAQLLFAAQAVQAVLLQASFQATMVLPVPFTNAAGVASSYPNMNTVSFNGKTAMQNLEAVINAGAAAWTFKYWLDVNGIAQVFTFADVQGLAAAMSAQDTPSELNLVSKIGQMQKATTVSAVQKIIF